jgi:kynureninase
MLSLAAIEPGVDLVLEAGLERIRAKSARQTDFLRELWSEFLQPCGVGWNSPWDARQRGAHVSLSHPEGLRLARALIEMKVIPDFRAPDNLRLGMSPLYTSYSEIREAVLRLHRVLVDRLFEKFSATAAEVT